MTGSALGAIITAIVVMIVLMAWIVLVFRADASPDWRRRARAGHGVPGRASRSAAGWPEESLDCASRVTDASSRSHGSSNGIKSARS
jgi:hypothetical protein